VPLRLLSAFPPDKRWSRSVAVLIDPQMAVDDSGSEPQSPIFVLAGFIAPAAKWANFSTEWKQALDLPPKLEYFKMSEAVNFGGQFSRRDGWNDANRDDRLVTLARIIRKHVSLRVSAWIRHDDFEEHIKSLLTPVRHLGIDSPYVMLLYQLILAIAVFGDRHGLQSPCDYIFDDQGKLAEEAEYWWPSLKSIVEQSKRSDLAKFVGSQPIFRDEKVFLPLQAGDLYAWQIRNRYVENHQVPHQTIFVPPNRILGMMNTIPVINREYPTDEVIRLREHLLKTREQYAKAFPDVPLIGPYKNSKERRKAHKQAREARKSSVKASQRQQPKMG
jgi:hypothetical protein